MIKLTTYLLIINVVLLIIWMLLVATSTITFAANYTKRTDSAGYTHYYNSKGHQYCISRKDAAGYTHKYCDD